MYSAVNAHSVASSHLCMIISHVSMQCFTIVASCVCCLLILVVSPSSISLYSSSHPSPLILSPCSMSAVSAVIHEGVQCDYCNMTPFTGSCWVCKECPSFNLCDACHSLNPIISNHTAQHTFLELTQSSSLIKRDNGSWLGVMSIYGQPEGVGKFIYNHGGVYVGGMNIYFFAHGEGTMRFVNGRVYT